MFQPCNNGHARTLRTWAVPPLMLLLSLYAWVSPPSQMGYWVGLVVLFYFAIVFVIDMEHRLILHPTSIFGSFLGLGVGFATHGISSTLKGGFAGLLILLFFYYFGVLFSRIRAGRLRAKGQEVDDEEALGFGDVILATILGLMLGWPMIWFSLLMGILLAGAFGLLLVVFMLVVKRYKENALMVFMPYGPFLVLSAFLIIFTPVIVSALLPK